MSREERRDTYKISQSLPLKNLAGDSDVASDKQNLHPDDLEYDDMHGPGVVREELMDDDWA